MEIRRCGRSEEYTVEFYHPALKMAIMFSLFVAMAEKTKLSGAQNRKRKAEREREQAKQGKSLLRYFNLPKGHEEGKEPSSVPITSPDTEVAGCSTSTSEVNTDVPQTGTISSEEDTDDVIQNENIEKEDDTFPHFDYADPAKWPNPVSDDLRQLIVQNGPKQVVLHEFAKDSKNRRFSPLHYKRRLANGEQVPRQWLVYSVSEDMVFCFCCKLFTTRLVTSSLQANGSKDWKNIGAILSSHERNADHIENYQAWRELELRLLKRKTIDEFNQQKIREEEQYWHQILQRLIALVRVLGMQNLAFRGTNDRLFTAGNGNFLKFVEFLALFDPLMSEHLRRIKDGETLVQYLGKDIQN